MLPSTGVGVSCHPRLQECPGEMLPSPQKLGYQFTMHLYQPFSTESLALQQHHRLPVSCSGLYPPEQLSPLNKHQLLFIFIPPAFDLHLVTYFTAQELTCGSVVFSVMSVHSARFGIFSGAASLSPFRTYRGLESISHRHMSYRGKRIRKVGAPRHCSISAKYRAVAFSSNYSARLCSLGVFCAALKRSYGEI